MSKIGGYVPLQTYYFLFQVYPYKLCSSCRIMLDRISNSETAPSSIKIFDFVPHCDQCNICFKQIAARYTGMTFTSIDNVLKKHDFKKLANLNVPERVYYQLAFDTGNVSTPITLNVSNDYSWHCNVYGNQINKKCEATIDLPDTLSGKNIDNFAFTFSKLNICPGNVDFSDVIEARLDFREPFPAENGKSFATLETSIGHSKLEKKEFCIVRAVNCDYLVTQDKSICDSCKSIRKPLSKIRSRLLNKDREKHVDESSHVNARYMKIDELTSRLNNAQKSKREAILKAARLAVSVKKVAENDGVIVSTDQHTLFNEIIKNNVPNFEENTPQWLLWQQQAEQATKHKTSMRWHPLIIRWCLSIYLASPAAYRQMASKKNKFIVLPHVNTLKKYINFTDPCTGFNPDIIERLIEDAKVDKLEGFERNVSVVFDEMRIKSDLVYKKSTGKLIGFLEMGEINDEIKAFQNKCNDQSEECIEREFATYVNVFMVRGIFTRLAYPFGYHASTGLSSDQLFPLVWEATRILEMLGLKVRTWVCDGASPNRKFFKVNVIQRDGINYYWTWNLFAPDRKIYFISDVPHLIKTTRNNLENSHGNNNTRNLHVRI